MSRDLFIACIKLWWADFFYTEWFYYAFFLVIVMALYQITPSRFRKYVLLLADWFLFYSLSGFLIIYNFIVVIICREFGIRIERGSEKTKKILRIIGILIPLIILFIFKYLDFMGENLSLLSTLAGHPHQWEMLYLAVPVGISYYTLEVISYLNDVYSGTVKAERSYINLSLFLSFFPSLIEGPILKYRDVDKDLWAGHSITYESLTRGYQRIFWGLFKKLMIANHLAPAVKILFDGDPEDGSLALAGALFFTLEEYADFSGTIDIAIGSAEIFGITLPENFRQPFFAKNASDFWRRWHITLGRFLRDYVFYPVAVSKGLGRFSKKIKKRFGKKAAKLITPTISLFCVWIINGIWHGPKWNYMFYGMYFFVLIFLETLLEEPFSAALKRLHLTEQGAPVRVFRFVKLVIIVIIGEMFFRAEDMAQGFAMLKSILTDFHGSAFIDELNELGLDIYDYIIVIVSIIILFIVGVLKERNISIRGLLMKCPVPVRYLLWYAAIMAVVIFGAYGSGYSGGDYIYAMF